MVAKNRKKFRYKYILPGIGCQKALSDLTRNDGVICQRRKLIQWISEPTMSLAKEVRINQKSQENSQKRASTGTRIRREQKEANESKPKPEKSSLSQSQPRKVKGQMGQIKAPLNLSQAQSHVAMVKAQIYVGFALNSLTKEAQAVTSRNDSLAIPEVHTNDPTAYNGPQMIEEMIG
ncbi:hypothetical protein Tco_0267664 [Tanacetum coccineum]